jgi:DNA polymerase-3 subunit delta'
MDKETLFHYEPKLAKLFENSRKSNRLSNAYLLYGDRNAPLKETAVYLSESLSCEKDLFACRSCPSCRRFENGVRPDFALIDGEVTTIKKEDIRALESAFSLSALEKGHRLTYVIHRIENITEEASNSLLKFLEEPKEGQVAFLTSYNLTSVLPTILSRCILIRVDPISPEAFYQDLLGTTFTLEGEKEKITLSAGEAYILSRLYSDKDEVRDLLFADDSFRTGFAAAEAFLNDLAADPQAGAFTLLRQVSLIKDSKCYNWLYLTISKVFTAGLVKDSDPDNPFAEVIQSLSQRPEALERGEAVIRNALASKQLNYNPTSVSAKLLTALE